MAYEVGTTISNPSNNSVASLRAALAAIEGADPTTAAEVDSILQTLTASGVADNAPIVPVSTNTTLDASGGTLYTLPQNSNLTIGGTNTPAGSHINVLAGDNSNLTLLNDPAGGKASFNVIASGGNNAITLNKGPSQVTSTVGNDTIISKGGKDTITGGSGHDTITAGGRSFVQAGTAGDTVTGGLRGTSHDTIVGGSGSDQLVVAHGNNLLVGTTGRTYIQAGDGKDTILGGTGRETIWGSGSTYIQAAKGNIIHGQGSDTIYGGAGRNTIQSSNGGQYIEGGKGHLEINVSKTANDTIFGGSHHDVVHVAQFESSIADVTTSGNVQTITFANGQTLTTQNVTIEFKDHHK